MFDYDMTSFEKEYEYIAGIDEVGRGPLAGPVVACAIIMPKDEPIEGVKDSKKLSKKKREQLDILIREKAVAIGMGVVEENIIDEINIKAATRLAMKMATLNLRNKKDLVVHPDMLVIDAEKVDMDIPQEAIIKGDDRCYPIACASIVAKVYRDKMFLEYDKQYPGYDFINNKGYGTKKHIEGIKKNGVIDIHRRSFLKNILGKDEN